MFTNAEKNYLLNIALGVSSLACIITGFILKLKIPALMVSVNIKMMHEWTGYLMSALVVLHLLMHLKWMQALTKIMVSNKKKLITTLLVLFVSLALVLGLITLLPAGKFHGVDGPPTLKQTDVKRM